MLVSTTNPQKAAESRLTRQRLSRLGVKSPRHAQTCSPKKVNAKCSIVRKVGNRK